MWQRKIQLYQIKCKGRNSLKTLHLSLFFFKYIISEYTAQFIENNVAYFVLNVALVEPTDEMKNIFLEIRLLLVVTKIKNIPKYQAIIYGIILCVMFANAFEYA